MIETVIGTISFHFRSLSMQKGDSLSTIIVPLFLVSMVLVDTVFLTGFIGLEEVDDDDDDGDNIDVVDVTLDGDIEEAFDDDMDLVCDTDDGDDGDNGLSALEPPNDVIDLLCVAELTELVGVFAGECVEDKKDVLCDDFDKKELCVAGPLILPPLLATILFVSSMLSWIT